MAEVVRMVSVNALVTQTKAAWDRADLKSADADDWYVRTGKLLAELKGRVGHGNWLPTLEKIGRSERRAQELMEQAKGKKTPKQDRERKRASMKKSRAKSAQRGAHSEPDEPDDTAEMPLEERWQYSLANLCGDILAIAPYWDKQFPGWEAFECPSHVRKLVREAATALASITATVAKRDRKVG